MYAVGVVSGSIPNRDRRTRGVEANINVGRIECRKVTGAIDSGSTHEPIDLIVGRIERGPFVEGVNSSFVLAISSGARANPAIPAAETETSRESRGDGEENKSSRAREDGEGNEATAVCAGSGRARIAQRNDLKNEDIVENRTLCQNVLFVPFQTPQAPSSLHNLERTAVMDDVDSSNFVWP